MKRTPYIAVHSENCYYGFRMAAWRLRTTRQRVIVAKLREQREALRPVSWQFCALQADGALVCPPLSDNELRS